MLKKSKVPVARILKTGGVQALTFGQDAMGVTDSTLLCQRRAVAASLVLEGQRGDLDLTLALAEGKCLAGSAKLDPAFAAHLQPLGAWAEAVWCSWLPRASLGLLMQMTLPLVGPNWAKVRGPAAACVKTAARLGWVVHDTFHFTTDGGMDLDLHRDSPAFVKQHVSQSVIRWRSTRIAEQFPSMRCERRNMGPHLGQFCACSTPVQPPRIGIANCRGRFDRWSPGASGRSSDSWQLSWCKQGHACVAFAQAGASLSLPILLGWAPSCTVTAFVRRKRRCATQKCRARCALTSLRRALRLTLRFASGSVEA